MMYSEWTSLASSLPNKIKPGTDDENVLLRFSADVSRDVASLILKQLASNLGITHTAQLSILDTEKDVLWCMEVISYGLNLPLSDHDTIRDCVNVYCEWLSVFDKTPKISVPKPISRDPNFFAKKIITHLYNLFIPRKVEEADGVSKQAVLCHRVLRTLQHIVQNSNILTDETWNCLLLFLLSINDILLFPDITHEDNVADQLCQRVLSVLVEVWLVACQRCFPTPSFWKTFREFSIKWRHRNIVIEQWNTMNLMLTSRVLEIMYGTPFLIHKTCPEDVRYIVKSMNNDCVVQTWFRILNNIGNPVDLSHRINTKPNNSKQLNIISRQSSSEFGVAAANYSSPVNFFNAMKGLATIIDSFLKISSYKFESYTDVPGKLTCNSILHLFGEWLFEASYSGVEVVKFLKSKIEPPFSELTRSSSTGSQPNSSIELDIDIIAALNGGKYISGYSEALGILCRIFSSKRAKEEILPIYLSRFYTIVQQGLKINELGECTELMISILLNSSTLFRTDLDGILLLITYFVDSLELLLSDKHLKLKTLKNIPESELRGSVINLLLSLLPFPLHYQNMVLKELTTTTKFYVTFTFGHLRSKLVAILINALQFETDCFNTQILLSGLLFLVQDFALYEEIGTFNHMQSAWSLFVKGTYLVCHRLISSWKTDLNISLPALELLSSIAKVQMHQECDVLEYKQIVKWLCDYITVQCSQPPPAHSKDLHSGIVAAFYCIIIWLTENRWLLHDDECLYMLLEVVELGISGSKSQKSKNAGSKMKDEKDSKPASLRVRDASECLLVFILQQVDCKLLINGNGSLIPFPLKKIRGSNFGENFLTKDSKFHYFVLDASMMSILYLPTANYNNNEDDFFQPTMKFVVRDICGYYTWILQFRQLPRNKSLTNQNQGFNYGHPISMADPSTIHSPNHTFFPERVEKIPGQNIDNCMPSIDDLSKSILQNDSMIKFIDEHKNLETQPRQKLINFEECVIPTPCTKLNTGRMFLSHFGLFSKSTSGQFPPISSLNSTKAGFEKDLTDLDNTTTASWNLCYMFYMKNGQKNITDIINNIGVEKMLCQHFLEILYSLGWPVKSSFVMDDDSASFNFFENKGIDSFYWSDLTSQILYSLPTSKLATNLETKDTIGKHPDFDKFFLETDGMTISLTKQCLNFPVISIVWIENYADYANFPIDEMCALIGSLNIHKPVQRADCCIIFLHLLQNGLLQMKFVGPTTRTGLTASLIDGMVISRRVAGTLIRQTVVNTYKRKTLDNDSYNIPHVRRRSKIQEFVNKYRYKISSPELLEHLLS